MFAATKAFFAKAVTTLTPSWVLDFSTGAPWANGTDYNYTSTRTAGTYVDSSGYVARIVANLSNYSEDFSNAYWTKNNASITSNATTAPDGTTTADELIEDTANNSHVVNSGLTISSGTTYTVTVYAKANTRSVVYISGLGLVGAGKLPQFDLSNGTDVSVGTGMTTSIESIGNAWYRCRVTYTATGTAGPAVGILNQVVTTATISYTGNGTSGAYFWGVQIVEGSEALPYSKTTNAANGIPRLTHDSSGNRLGLLVEEQRTNTLQFSEDPANAYYAKTNASIDNNGGAFWTSPANVSDAVRLKQDTATGVHNIARAVSGTDTCFSVFIKKQNTSGVGRYATLIIRRIVSEYYHATFDLDAGTVTQSAVVGTAITATDRGIENYGNDWYRCWVRGTQASASHTLYVALATTGTPTMTSTGESYTGANTTDGIYIWGLMREANNTAPTSYIETPSSASITRSADNAYILDSKITSWQDPGALVIHFYPPGQAGTLISSDDGANTQLGIQASSTTAARAFWSSGNTSTGTIGASGVQKAVHYWNGTNSRFSINGSSVVTGTNDITTFGNLDFLTLGSEATDSAGVPGTYTQFGNVIVRKVEWYAGTFSDSQLQQMTQ